ncbi:hypothetical protein TWF106_007450 [Orbilia oligospora]|uniref:Uncharacterized protein n=1 Tax=Orbilia oligospora TaxID=2813651 RepID=A0A6G1MBY7_ORBOL|nr:hypothetical protein TWF788_011197 [Orbilia oligospora]KAF3212925.1 hypothetical protein TWF679_005493 [Orbilia oligospora]KAF3228204.1 hypothetical protein TWF191_002708 [Orbilia oligospora]KAF3228418.1 hypothetical protein TWF106_007450 [Orbilia oligospora]KAF3252987.1 hypothetical protein TWF192_004271 [Orbilia oligospora]
MVGFMKSVLTVTAVFGFFAGGLAAPAPAPEIDYLSLIKPGPGFPTPQQLNLTNADLAKPAPALAKLMVRETLEKRYNPQCWGEPRCNYNDAVGCYNYLNSLGSTTCAASGVVRMCSVNGCNWYARSLNGYSASPCYKAAAGGAWVINNCNVGGRLSGSNAAYDNGNLAVDILAG